MTEAITLCEKIEIWPIERLKAYDRNPRTHSREQVQQVADSIVEFGFNNPILVDANQGIIAGACRYMAAQRLGLKAVPVIELTHLSDAQKRAYVIADNRLAESAGWDLDLLSGELKDLSLEGFDLCLTGFSVEELDKLLSRKLAGLSGEDDIPEAPDEPVSLLGDVWVLGHHRLVCGDSTAQADIEKLMRGSLADCVWTDPPYNVNYGDKAEALQKHNKGHRNTSRILNDNMGDREFYEFLLKVFKNTHAAAGAGAPIYVAHAETEGINFRQALKDAGFYQAACLIWVKNALVLGRSDYQWKHEPILYGWKPTGAHAWYGGRDKTSVCDHEEDLFSANAVTRTGENEWQVSLGEAALVIRGENITIEKAHGSVFYEPKPAKNPEHPTMKPVALIERMVCNSSRRGDLVFDPFGGSGSTLIACEKSGRIARLIELDPKYADVIVRRWEDYSGMTAALEATGQAFEKVEEERKK